MKRVIESFVFATCTLSAAHADIVSYQLSGATSASGWVSSGAYNPLSIYSEPGGFGVAFLLPPLALVDPVGGGGNNSNFMKALTGAFGTGWSFTAGNDLGQFNFVVNADQVAGGPNNPCYQGGGDCVGIYGAAGKTNNTAGFAVSYTGEPILDPHWIQVITTNSPATGKTSPYVDNKGSTANPYYDIPYAANATAFLDAPNRNPTQSQYWLADLYYASGGLTAGTKANPTPVDIYNGMLWGWADIWVPTTNFLSFISIINADLTSVASLDGALGADLSGILNQSSVTQLDSEFDSAAAPEPSTWMLLLIGVGLIAICRPRRSGLRWWRGRFHLRISVPGL
jgi:hypothetical protein